MNFASSTPLTTLVQNFTALKNNSNKCDQDQDQDQDLKQCKKNDLQYGFIIVLLSFYLYLLNQPLPEPKKSNGTDGTFNITLRPYSFNIPGKIKVIEKVIINTQNSTLFTVPAGKRFLLYSVMEINTSTTTTSLNTISALSFKLDQTTVQPNSAYTVNVTLIFEEGESLLWQATTVPTSAQIIKVFYVELNQSDNIPLFSFKKFVTSIAPISTLMQAASSGPAIIISGYNGFQFDDYFNPPFPLLPSLIPPPGYTTNYNNTTSPTTSTIYSCSVDSQNYTANIYIDNFKVGQSGFFVINNSQNLSPSSASIHPLNYGLNGIGFVISPNSTVQVGPVSGGPSGIFVYGTYYQF